MISIFFFVAAGFADDVLEGDRGAGGGVFLVGVVAFEDLARVVVAQGCCGSARYVEEKIHADGEICGVEESSFVLLDQGADVVDVLVPAGRADDHVLAGFDAGFDMGEDAWGVVKSMTASMSRSFSSVSAAQAVFSLEPAMRA